MTAVWMRSLSLDEKLVSILKTYISSLSESVSAFGFDSSVMVLLMAFCWWRFSLDLHILSKCPTLLHLLHVLFLLRLHSFPLCPLAPQRLHSIWLLLVCFFWPCWCVFLWSEFWFCFWWFFKMVSLVLNDDGNGAHLILLDLLFQRLMVLISVLW